MSGEEKLSVLRRRWRRRRRREEKEKKGGGGEVGKILAYRLTGPPIEGRTRGPRELRCN